MKKINLLDSLMFRSVLICLFVSIVLFTGRSFAAEVVDTVSWVGPTTRADMTDYPIDERAGYRIYGITYESTSTDLEFLVDIPNPATLTYSLTYDLPYSTTAYTTQYVVTAYDIWDNESAFSEVATKSFLSSPSVAPSRPTGVIVE